MKFTIESAADLNLVRAYTAEELRIGERRISRPCLLSATMLVEDFLAARLSEVTLESLAAAVALQPQLIVFGGDGGIAALPGAVRGALHARGIGVEVMDLGAACRTYNVLVSEGRQVAAALFPRKAT